jgi:hypothetical protein
VLALAGAAITAWALRRSHHSTTAVAAVGER